MDNPSNKKLSILKNLTTFSPDRISERMFPKLKFFKRNANNVENKENDPEIFKQEVNSENTENQKDISSVRNLDEPKELQDDMKIPVESTFITENISIKDIDITAGSDIGKDIPSFIKTPTYNNRSDLLLEDIQTPCNYFNTTLTDCKKKDFGLTEVDDLNGSSSQKQLMETEDVAIDSKINNTIEFNDINEPTDQDNEKVIVEKIKEMIENIDIQNSNEMIDNKYQHKDNVEFTDGIVNNSTDNLSVDKVDVNEIGTFIHDDNSEKENDFSKLKERLPTIAEVSYEMSQVSFLKEKKNENLDLINDSSKGVKKESKFEDVSLLDTDNINSDDYNFTLKQEEQKFEDDNKNFQAQNLLKSDDEENVAKNNSDEIMFGNKLEDSMTSANSNNAMDTNSNVAFQNDESLNLIRDYRKALKSKQEIERKIKHDIQKEKLNEIFAEVGLKMPHGKDANLIDIYKQRTKQILNEKNALIAAYDDILKNLKKLID